MDFSELYLSYYPKLLRFAKDYVIAQEDAENIIQDVFEGLWEKRGNLQAVENINAYIFKLVRNKCIDHLRYKLSVDKYNKAAQTAFEIELTLKLQSLDSLDAQFMSEGDVEKIVKEAIDSLPAKCREIFLLSRIEGMKYKDIAEKLDISVNTVENQISIALRKLRVKLKKYLSL